MPWEPTHNTIRSRRIADNLLAHFAANQVDAIEWANGGQPLRPLRSFSTSVADRANPVFPAIMFTTDEDAQDLTGDIIRAAYTVTFEILVQSPSAATAVAEADAYSLAIRSMIQGCPPETVAAGTGADAAATVLESLESGFDEIRSNEQQNDFLQSFRVRAVYRLTAAAYA